VTDGMDGYTVESDQRVTRTSSEVVRQIQTHPLCFMNHVKKFDRRGGSGATVLTEAILMAVAEVWALATWVRTRVPKDHFRSCGAWLCPFCSCVCGLIWL